MAAFQRELPLDGAIVSRAIKEWVSVLWAEASNMDVGSRLSAACRVPGCVLELTHSDHLSFWVFDDRGQLVGSSDFGDEMKVEGSPSNRDESSGLGDNVEALARLGGVEATEVRSALEARHPLRDDNLEELCTLLGIEAAYCSYHDFFREATCALMTESRDALGPWWGAVHVVPRTDD